MASPRKQIYKLVTVLSQPRNLLSVFLVLVFLYFLLYLLFAKPASDVYYSKRVHEKSGRKNPESFVQEIVKNPVIQFPLKKKQVDPIKYVQDGEGVWVGKTDINIMSAIQDIHYPIENELRIMVLGFVRHSAHRDFVCCFSTKNDPEKYVEVPSKLEFIDLRFLAEYQNAVFECIVGNKEGRHFDSIFLAPKTCSQDSTSALKIVYPVKRSYEFAVCTKVSYARLEPYRLIEWFEFMLEFGVSKVVTFTNNIHADSKDVFDFYAEKGVLKIIDFKPRSRNGTTGMIFDSRTGQSRQARQDKSLTVRDCQYRLGGYQYVMSIDFDEMPIPQRPYGTLNWALMSLALNETNVSAFRLNPVLLMPQWQSNDDHLYHLRYSMGTTIQRYNTKWVYIPARTWLASTHENIPKKGYQTAVAATGAIHFVHYRECKSDWKELDCDTLKPTVKNESSLTRFAGLVLNRMRKVPLVDLIKNNPEYVKNIFSDVRGMKKEEKLSLRRLGKKLR